MHSEAYLLIRMIKKDTNSKDKSIETVRKIGGVKKADLAYGSEDIIMTEVEYDDSIEDTKLIKIVEKISKSENIWIYEVYRK